MKRLVMVLLCGLMMLSGCSGKPSESTQDSAQDPVAKMTPGTYTSVSAGYKGDIKLDVTVTEDEITEIKVVESKESVGIGAEALNVLIEKVIKYQTANVDSVAGATFTSFAFKASLKDALTQAGADMGKFDAKPVIE